MKHRFDIRKSPVDGMLRVWETRRASSVVDLLTGEALVDPEAVHDGHVQDYDVQVCTGVYKRRKDVFADRGLTR